MKRITIYLLFGCWLLAAAGGCSVQKKCKAPELEIPEEIVAGERDSLSISDRNWWEIYSDTIARCSRPKPAYGSWKSSIV